MALLEVVDIEKIGFRKVGEGVKISDKASFYGVSHISIDDNVRIDDFCVLSAGELGITIGRNVHLSTGVSIVGRGKVVIGNFVALSIKVSIFSSNDDYSGKAMVNPTISEKFTNVTHGEVIIGKHVVVGAGSVVLPNVHLGEGVAIGALSLVKSDCECFWIYGGIPAKKLKKRDNSLLSLEKRFLNEKT